MKTCRSLAEIDRRKPVVLAAGFFDGVHRGHRALLRRSLSVAENTGGVAWAMTFDPHPLKLLAPSAAPAMLTGLPRKLQLLDKLGMPGCVVLPFTAELADCEPEAFIADLSRQVPRLTAVCAGPNWTFGRAGRGNPELLAELARHYGFRALVVRPTCWHGAAISSTRIRHALAAGQLSDVRHMLGRPFSVVGRVVRGNGIGRRLGTPTANIATEDEALPPPGVYSVTIRLGTRQHLGVANLGLRPTLGAVATSPLLEIHILDFNSRIYNRSMEIVFRRRVRDEKCFGSLDLLREQIMRDIRSVRQRPG
ncbi:MAG: riboflavin biosynthesis protein RibF [Kiritimatiellia bacterium]|nr:riboflavin biosynthesis protein RibF [Lentisphaerota bacterium]